MRLEFLGTGGAVTTPRPGCACSVCAEARGKGGPYSRSGPSLFVHGPDILIDTPEEIKDQLNRSNIGHISACLYSHWHPDHVMGRRVWETMNADFRNRPSSIRSTDIYLPEQVSHDFDKWLGSGDHFSYMEKHGWVHMNHMTDGDTAEINGVKVSPFRLAEDYVYAFLLEEKEKRVLIAPDELNRWQPPGHLKGVDLAVLPMGIADVHPLTGERSMPEDHPVLQFEATFEETLHIIKQLEPKRVILTHIEEMAQLGYDDLKQIEQQLQDEGWPLTFAYDMLSVHV